MKINDIYNKVIQSEADLDKLVIEERLIKNEIDFSKLQYFDKKTYKFTSDFEEMSYANISNDSFYKNYGIYFYNFPMKYISNICANIFLKSTREFPSTAQVYNTGTIIQVFGIDREAELRGQTGKIKYTMGIFVESWDSMIPVLSSISLTITNPRQYQ